MSNIKVLNSNLELKLLAQGNTAEVYMYDENKVLKLFRENMPVEPIKNEFDKAKYIQTDIINVPKVYEIIKFKKRYGIVYERIDGRDMIKDMLMNFLKIKTKSKDLAHIHVQLHTEKTGLTYTVKSKLCNEIDDVLDLSTTEKNKIKKYIDKLPDGNALCHFDFHPGNIIIQNEKPIIIDWMTACVGNPCADVARTYLLLQYGELQHVNWIVKKIAHAFENYIGKVYIEEYKKCSGISDFEFKQWILPVAAARLIEWVSDNERRELIKLIKKELEKI